MSQETQESKTGLPGMKRGIAIGVAGCVAVLVIAALAAYVVRRRRRISRARRDLEVNTVELPATEVWAQEKSWRTATPPAPPPPPPPPVEADARTIYEMDATQIPELPSETDAHDIKKNNQPTRNSWCLDDDAAYTQKQRDQWNIPENRRITPPYLPLLTVSAPMVSPGEVSPLLVSTWDTLSRSTSPVSALPDAHLPSQRYGQWNR
ncbi:Nn.00g106680.m01.CDS01 [Neocucurbitaria sp. VM-36]